MYRHIAGATQFGQPVSSHHYINESRPTEDQFMIEVHWTEMTVHVKTLTNYDANEWTTVSVTPLDARSPASS